MTHPAIDEAAVHRLRATLAGTPTEIVEAVDGPGPPAAPSASGQGASLAKVKANVLALASRVAAPGVARLRQELANVAAGDQSDVRAELASLREELARTRAEHNAELAALHEEVAASRHPGRYVPS